MPITNGAYVNPGWVNSTTPAISATELNAISDTLECVPVANGGTGSTTAAAARTALGITASNIGAVSTSGGDTVSGDLTVTGKVTVGSYGTTVPISKGGTGQTTVAAARNALGLGNTSGAVPIANGGTGQTTVAAARNALGLGNTSGAVPIANGGTGGTTVAKARNNLGLGNTSGAVPVANGGTGATTAQAALTTLLNGTNMILTSSSYGSSLPSSGTTGQLFFKAL